MSTKNNNDSEQEKSGSFFQNLFASLFAGSNPEAEKKRKLKAIAKAYSKSKYHNFYKPSSIEMQAPFGKLFYELYKAISSAQIYFKSAQNPAIFNRQIINYSLSDHQLELLEQLDEQKILELAKQIPFKELQQQVEEKLQAFSVEFDGARVGKTENIYKAFTLFKDFCMFDFYMILKKFDSSMQEFTFTSTPKLEKINAEYIVEDLKDFTAVAYAVTDDSVSWDDLFTMFKQTTGKDLISLGNWKKIVAKLKSIQLSGSFDLIIQHISQDPKYETELHYTYESLVEPYIDKIQNETRTLLDKISAQQKASKSNSICMQIFGTSDPHALSNYVPGFNAVLEKKNLSTIEFAEPLNYLKTFLLEYVKKDIREYFDVVVIRGQWDSSLSAPISNAYQELLKIADEITLFDDAFSEEGTMGIKIKTLLPKTAHDSGAENIINRVISDANEQAKGFILTSTQNLITIGKTIKQLIEDYQQSKPVIVQNWKELEKYIDVPMKDFCVGIYKKIYMFVQLIQQYLS